MIQPVLYYFVPSIMQHASYSMSTYIREVQYELLAAGLKFGDQYHSYDVKVNNYQGQREE